MNFIRPAISLFILLSLITGIVYPLLITGIGHALFPEKVTGSLISNNNKVIGSALIGQHFTDAKYFWGRPSATGGNPYNSLASGGSNLGPLNPALMSTVKERAAGLNSNGSLIPVELVTASASGLDPHISPAAAHYQIPRVATARNLNPSQVEQLVNQYTENRQLGLLGEPRINVLQLNLALDQLKP